jgi:hypothetical protein
LSSCDDRLSLTWGVIFDPQEATEDFLALTESDCQQHSAALTEVVNPPPVPVSCAKYSARAMGN